MENQTQLSSTPTSTSVQIPEYVLNDLCRSVYESGKGKSSLWLPNPEIYGICIFNNKHIRFIIKAVYKLCICFQ